MKTVQGSSKPDEFVHLDSQIAFMRHVYDSQQSLIRQLDTKAGVFVTLLVFLISGVIPLVGSSCSQIHWSGTGAVTSWLYLVSGCAMVISFVATVLCVYQVVRPRGSTRRAISAGLMFAGDIIRQGDPENYHELAMQSSSHVYLKNLSSEVFQLSSIVDEKTRALRVAKWPTILSFMAWACNVIAAGYIATWR